MSEEDDSIVAGVQVSALGAAPKGGEPRRLSRQSCPANDTNCTLRQSHCREFVANHTGAPSDKNLSLKWNQAGKPGGAVPPLAFASSCVIGPGTITIMDPARSPPIGILCRLGTSPPVQLVRCQRFSRLCVLMNPILPGERSIWTEPAKCLKPYSCGPDSSGGTQEVNRDFRSVNEPAHTHIHRRAQRQERKQHRRPSVTH